MAGERRKSKFVVAKRYAQSQLADTEKLMNRAAKILDLRAPSRTRIESAAQPVEESIAMISGNTVRWNGASPHNLMSGAFAMGRQKRFPTRGADNAIWMNYG